MTLYFSGFLHVKYFAHPIQKVDDRLSLLAAQMLNACIFSFVQPTNLLWTLVY